MKEDVQILSKLLVGNIVQEEPNDLQLQCKSFLEPFKHIVFSEEGFTELQLNCLTGFPELTLGWEESKIQSNHQKLLLSLSAHMDLNELQKDERVSTTFLSVMKQNEEYRLNLNALKAKLQDIVYGIQKQLSSLQDLNYPTDFLQKSLSSQCLGLANFIQIAINKISENNSRQNLDQDYLVLKVQNKMMSQDVQKLLDHIEERKKYTQKLKSKIGELKADLIKEMGINQCLQKKLEETLRNESLLKSMLEELKNIEEGVELKFRSRNDLIMMIKSFSMMIMKHQKECQSWSVKGGEEIQNLLINSVKKKA